MESKDKSWIFQLATGLHRRWSVLEDGAPSRAELRHCPVTHQ